jgi:hypothetical protein
MKGSIIPGVLTIFVGIRLLYWVGKRRFMRRGVGGLQQFSSYRRALINIALERVAQILGVLLIVAGLLWVLVAHMN